jgi:predicted TIM-barrel fold metal-dependent hydrolase
MIVDVHCHAGYDYSFDDVYPPEKIMQKAEKYKDLIQIVQPGTTHSLEKAQKQHDEVYELAKSYPGKIIGMAAPNPHFEDGEYFGEIERCVKDLKFNSIKLQTFATATNPDSEAGRRVFRAAQKFKIPVLIHTGNGLPFASPIKILNVAKEFPDVSIIMSHTGAIVLADEVPVVLSQCKNVYGDTSWAPGYLLMDWVKRFPNRFMFASDLADNFETELTKVKTYGFSPEEQRSILQDTALEVFKIN